MKKMMFILIVMFVTVFVMGLLFPYEVERLLVDVPEQAIRDIQQDFPEFTEEEAVRFYLENKEEIDAFYASHADL